LINYWYLIICFKQNIMENLYSKLQRISCLILVFLIAQMYLQAQTAITAVTTSNSAATSSQSYVIGANTYNWGVSPDNNVILVDGFIAGGVPYTYASFLTGNVKLRRVNNANVSGNFTLIWAETVTSGTNFNMLPEYQADMEPFFNNRVYNKGTDNFFDNTSANSNNVERLDWIVSAGFSTANPSKLGFAIFERGVAAAHDPFCIAAITSLDAFGNPATYGPIVRVATASYGDPGPAVSYRIVKAAQPGNLVDAGANSQTRGGVIVSLQNLGIAAGSTIYGYSLFANDLPGTATPADLVNVNNATFFPTNTGNPGGIDLIAVTGLYIETSLLPVRFTAFAAAEKNGLVQLNWEVEGEDINTRHYILERSNGNGFVPFAQIPAKPAPNGKNKYTITDSTVLLPGSKVLYRIRQVDADGRYSFSPVVSVSTKKAAFSAAVYPNPAGNTIYLQLSAVNAAKAQLQLTDMLGRIVVSRVVTISTGSQVLSIEAAHLPAGRYHLRVQAGENLQNITVNKQ
jgi:Secretion system C-terminal sorting domain